MLKIFLNLALFLNPLTSPDTDVPLSLGCMQPFFYFFSINNIWCFLCFLNLYKWYHIIHVILQLAIFLLNVVFLRSVHVCFAYEIWFITRSHMQR